MKNKLTLLLLFVFVFVLLPALIGELSIGGIRLVQSQDCQARSRRRHRAAPRRTKYSYTNHCQGFENICFRARKNSKRVVNGVGLGSASLLMTPTPVSVENALIRPQLGH